MSRKAKHTDEEVDDRIGDFRERAGRMPTYSEVRDMCPLGLSNDRIASARARAADQIADEVRRVEAEAAASPLATLKALSANFDLAIRKAEASHQKEVRELRAEIKDLRAAQERIVAERSADIAKAAAEARRTVEEKLGAALHASLAVHIEEIFAAARAPRLTAKEGK